MAPAAPRSAFNTEIQDHKSESESAEDVNLQSNAAAVIKPLQRNAPQNPSKVAEATGTKRLREEGAG